MNGSMELRTRRTAAALVFWVAMTAAPVLAGDPPYLKLAQALGTPHLVESSGPSDHSNLLLKFTPEGETADKYTKLTTVSILKVEETAEETETAARAIIVRLRDEAKARKANVEAFDESPIAPVTLYYAFSDNGDVARGIVYSPRPGYVTAAQIDAKNGGTVSAADIAKLKSIIAPH
jgi:hypothetical protein